MCVHIIVGEVLAGVKYSGQENRGSFTLGCKVWHHWADWRFTFKTIAVDNSIR